MIIDSKSTQPALLMATSSLSVTLNTLRMRGFVPAIRRRGRPKEPQAVPAVQPVAEAVSD